MPVSSTLQTIMVPSIRALFSSLYLRVFASLALAIVVGPLALDRAAAASPNIVLIFIDDMGYADIGPFGNTEVRTPHLDRMAKEGMKFTSYYAAPLCSMSRASLMTGCYNVRVSIPGVIFPEDKFGLNPAEITLAEIVKPKGYATAAIGKWHLGHMPEFLPTRQGFDEYFGLPYSNDMGGKVPLPLMRNEQVIETAPDQSQLTRRYTEEAVKFIRAHRETPFFLYLPHTMVHMPLAASENFKGKSKLGLIGDAIEEIDWSVGELMNALKESGLDEKTLVIFTSDNGPAKRDAPPFRGQKASCFEGGVREPCIMRWPGKVPAGTTCSEIVGNIDMLPTIAKLSGAELPRDRQIDGSDISPLLLNPNSGPVRDIQLYFNGGPAANARVIAIRQGPWKLFVHTPTSGPKDKKPQPDRSPPVLYHLINDPGESKDVAAEHPEIVSRLLQEAKTREAEIKQHQRPMGMAK